MDDESTVEIVEVPFGELISNFAVIPNGPGVIMECLIPNCGDLMGVGLGRLNEVVKTAIHHYGEKHV